MSNAFDITAADALGEARCCDPSDRRHDDREGTDRGRVGCDSEKKAMRPTECFGLGGEARHKTGVLL